MSRKVSVTIIRQAERRRHEDEATAKRVRHEPTEAMRRAFRQAQRDLRDELGLPVVGSRVASVLLEEVLADG
jgi:hypothetical protein